MRDVPVSKDGKRPVCPPFPCMAGRLMDNFVGPGGSLTVTATLNVAAVAVFRPAVAMLPGPGWVYVGAAVVYDVGMVAKSYVECRNGGAPIGETPAGEQPEEE